MKNYLPEFLGVILAGSILNLWYLSSIAVENEVLPISYDYVFKGLTVLTGAFIGAFSAFKLNAKRETNQIYNDQKIAINKAIFIGIRQINAVKSMLNLYSPYKNELDRAFNLPAVKPPSYDDLKFDFEGLSFLLEGHPQLLMKLSIEQERFEQAFIAIEVRNNLYVNEVQPLLSNLERNGKKIDITVLENALGERLFKGSINGAAMAYALMESSDLTLVEMHDEISKIARVVFPGEKFVKWYPVV